MNSIKIKSGMREIEITTDHPCSPRDLVEAAKDAMQMTSSDTAIMEAVETPQLPEIIQQKENIIPMEAKVIKPEKRRSVGSGEEAQARIRIGELIAEGKFDNTELSLSDVKKILSSMTYNFGEPAISNALTHYVRQKQLIRSGIRLKYKYSKRLESTKSQPPQPVATENTTTTLDTLVASQ
jgi:hypothetical protein